LFDNNGHIHKYDKVQEIMEEFYDVRLEYYEKRKNHLSMKLSDDWEKLENKMRFILAVIHGELVVSNRKKSDILRELQEEGYKMFFPVKKNTVSKEDDSEEDEVEDAGNAVRGYDYLLSMKLWSLTQEKVEALGAERDAKRQQLDELMAKTPEDLWHEDLDALEVSLDQFDADIAEAAEEESAARKKAVKARGKAGAKAKKAAPAKKKTAKKTSYDSDDLTEDEFDDDAEDSDFEEIIPKSTKRGAKATGVSKQSTTSNAAPKVSTSKADVSLKVTVPKKQKASVAKKVSPVKKAAPEVPQEPAAPLSLAERLLQRMQQNSTATSAPVKSASIFDFPSDSNSSQSYSEPMDLTSPATTPPKQVKKRAAKSSKSTSTTVNTLDNFVVYSPGVSTPQDSKKARKVATDFSTDDHVDSLTQSPESLSPPAKKSGAGKKTVTKKAAAPKKATVPKKAPAPKKAAAPKKSTAASKKKAIVIDSEDEDEEFEEPISEPIAKKTTAPRRQAAKKAITYVYSDDEDEEESDFEEEDDDDESDYE
jgi:DNA topoisomerase-2